MCAALMVGVRMRDHEQIEVMHAEPERIEVRDDELVDRC